MTADASLSSAEKEDFMRRAVALAQGAKGRTAPNPCVGALLVREGEVLAQGRHEFYGGPHAEVNCIADAGAKGVDPSSCTLFVTLEPCNHHGKTPPCTQAVLSAGIKHVVIGSPDPNPGVSGGGAEFLRSQGVQVESGIAEEACRDLIADFLIWATTDRPYVYVKMAATLDGKIATRTGHSQWVSGEASRKAVHELRARCGAVIVGGGTFTADNPRLNARGVETALASRAVVITSRLPAADADFFLLQKRAGETVFWTDEETAQSSAAEALQDLGCAVWSLPETQHGLDLSTGLTRLRQEFGIYDVLCEGGGITALRFLEQGLMDELHYYIAPKILGDAEAANVFTGRAPLIMDEALGLRIAEVRHSGDDLLMIMRPS
jgi:diaminohydroxyphosphoribosylaminopyrimidine deaminase/5-amino-6-(5-phosphoribosylamino)uracil reductase